MACFCYSLIAYKVFDGKDLFAYSFFKKGKYLSKVEFQLVELPYDSTIVSCLGINFTNEKESKYNEMVINTEEEYREFVNEVRVGRHEACQNVEFPQINFQEKTLVGTLASHWCRAYFERDAWAERGSQLATFFKLFLI